MAKVLVVNDRVLLRGPLWGTVVEVPLDGLPTLVLWDNSNNPTYVYKENLILKADTVKDIC